MSCESSRQFWRVQTLILHIHRKKGHSGEEEKEGRESGRRGGREEGREEEKIKGGRKEEEREGGGRERMEGQEEEREKRREREKQGPFCWSGLDSGLSGGPAI